MGSAVPSTVGAIALGRGPGSLVPRLDWGLDWSGTGFGLTQEHTGASAEASVE